MKRPAKAQPLDPNGPHSAIYLAGRREWNERYGSYIAQRDSWRLMAMAALGVAAVAVGGVIWQASQSQIVPYVVQTDRLGDAIAISRANVATAADPGVIRAQLSRVIADVRTVYVDVLAERAIIGEAYAMVDKAAPAFAFLNEYFAKNDPFKRGAINTVSAQVESVLPLPGGTTWRVEWKEDVLSRENNWLESSRHWQAVVTTKITPPTTDAAILVNPTGLFVESISWGERTVGSP